MLYLPTLQDVLGTLPPAEALELLALLDGQAPGDGAPDAETEGA